MIPAIAERMDAIVSRFDGGVSRADFSGVLAAASAGIEPTPASSALLAGDVGVPASSLSTSAGLAAMIRAAGGEPLAAQPSAVAGAQVPLPLQTSGVGTGEALGSGLPPEGQPYAEHFAAAGARYGVDPKLLAAVAWTESHFQADAVSPAGAIGLMQIMPTTAASLGVDPRDPVQAIDGAARYLRQAMDQFGDVRLAVAAYNAGPGAVQQHGGIPPYPETQAYVQKVMNYLNGALA